MVSTQKPMKNFLKILMSSAPMEGQSFTKYDISRKTLVFSVPISYMQLLDCYAIYCWKQLFKRKRMKYYLPIYVYI